MPLLGFKIMFLVRLSVGLFLGVFYPCMSNNEACDLSADNLRD